MKTDTDGKVYFEDISVGDTWRTETVTVTLEMIKDFASQYDPQPIHLDEAAGKASIFGGVKLGQGVFPSLHRIFRACRERDSASFHSRRPA